MALRWERTLHSKLKNVVVANAAAAAAALEMFFEPMNGIQCIAMFKFSYPFSISSSFGWKSIWIAVWLFTQQTRYEHQINKRRNNTVQTNRWKKVLHRLQTHQPASQRAKQFTSNMKLITFRFCLDAENHICALCLFASQKLCVLCCVVFYSIVLLIIIFYLLISDSHFITSRDAYCCNRQISIFFASSWLPISPKNRSPC